MTDKNTYLKDRLHFIIFWIILTFSLSYNSCRQVYKNRNLIQTIDERTRSIEQQLKHLQDILTPSLSDSLYNPSLSFKGIGILVE